MNNALQLPVRPWDRMLNRELPEDMERIQQSTLVQDCIDTVVWALLDAHHPYDPRVIRAVADLHAAAHDRAREMVEES